MKSGLSHLINIFFTTQESATFQHTIRQRPQRELSKTHEFHCASCNQVMFTRVYVHANIQKVCGREVDKIQFNEVSMCNLTILAHLNPNI